MELIVSQILAVASTTIITILLGIALMELLCNNDCLRGVTIQLADMRGTLFFVLLIIAFICFYTNCIVSTYLLFNEMDLKSNKRQYFQCLIWSKIPYEIGVLSMQFFFIFRLYFVFKESALKVNECMLCILIILEIIAFILGCIHSVFGPYLYIFKSDWFNPSIYINCLALLMSLIIDIIVTICFLEGLFKVTTALNVTKWKWKKKSILEMKSSECKESNLSEYAIIKTPRTARSDYTMEPMLATQQISMVNVITRNTLLCSIGYSTTFLLPTTKTIIDIILIHTIEYKPNIYKESIRALSSFDGSINIICMYLMFAFSRKQYNFLCKFCHDAMKKCCIFWTKKTVKQNRKTFMF